VRKVMSPRNGYADWEVTILLAKAMGFEMHYNHPSEIMDEIAALTPTFTGVSYAKLEELGSVQWPCNEKAPEGTPVMHMAGFVRGKGKFILTEYVPTDERTGPRFPLLLTTGRILSQYNVGAQTRRTENVVWHAEDRLEIHPHDAEQRGVRDGDWVRLKSRAGETTLRALITDRVAPGVVYTTFHHPDTQANVITTDFSDWATNCPEYKVTRCRSRPRTARPTGRRPMTSRRGIRGASRRRRPLNRDAPPGQPSETESLARRPSRRGRAARSGRDRAGADLQWRHLRRDDGHAAGLAGFRHRLQPR
jgi:formate dehydrogenase major subunit